MHIFLSRRKILLSVFFTSVIVRGVFFLCWLTSPFRYFHRIPGLDMETLLRFSEWAPGKEFHPLFVVHRILIYLVWLFNGNEHCIPAVVILQSLAGAAGAVMTADLVLMLWGKRKTALCAGIFYALYAPLLLYDFCILQESITTVLILAGVWGYVRCRVKHYPSKSALFSGILLGVSSIGRPVALLLTVIFPVKTFFDGKRRAAFFMLAGVLMLWSAAGGFNMVFSGSFNPFFRVMSYTVSFHAEKSGAAEAAPEAAKKKAFHSLTAGLPGRASKFFLAYEMPENLNWYFLRSRMTPLKYLPGPGLLMPVALAGFFLLLLRLRRREYLLPAILVLLALPLAARDPIGRYRLHLLPYFVICASYFFIVLLKNTRGNQLLCAAALAVSLAVNILCGARPFFRVSDHVSWGRAIEAGNGGQPSDASLKEYFLGWQKSNHSDRSAAVNLITSSLRSGNTALAVQTCQQGINGPAKEKSIYHYYMALIYVSAGNFSGAEKELACVREHEIPHLKEKITILRQVVQRKSL